jgi:hypothetical protein
LRKHADWSRRLPRQIIIPQLATLADVRKLIRHLPEDHRAKPTWQRVEKQLIAAALGDVDTTATWPCRCAWYSQWKAPNAVCNKAPPLPAAVVRRLLAKHPPPVLDPHFIRDACPQGTS